MRSKLHTAVAGAAALLALAATAPAAAVEVGAAKIHGYGNWAYGQTDGNTYMNGNDDGNYDELEFSLAVAAAPSPNVSIHAQIFVENEEEGAETSVDFAFAEYAFDEKLRFRIGAVKQPFGIYTEIFDVGTVYPFVNLAQGVYGPAGYISENYLGLGFTGRVVLGSGWSVQYDLYGGEMESDYTTPWAEDEGGEEGEEATTDVQDMIGGRILFISPGLAATCGVSAYTGTEDTETSGEESEENNHSAVGVQLEVSQGPATVRAEYAHQDTEVAASDAAYAEVSWRFNPHWLVAARYDWSSTDLDDDEGVEDELLDHQDLGFAVNYFFSPNMVLKLAWHNVDGNRFTSPDDEDEEQDDTTSLVTGGVSFSF